MNGSMWLGSGSGPVQTTNQIFFIQKQQDNLYDNTDYSKMMGG
jgi:hypothetical protein